MSIVNVAIPSIAGGLGASATESTWAISSYAMAAAAMQPLTGWLSKRLGQVRLFVISTILFTLASLLCGIAWNMGSLVAFRLLQGVVSGPMLPLSQALMLAIFPASKRGMALGIWAGTILVAPIFGPILGGWLSDNWSWRTCFYINLPIGLLSATALIIHMGKHDDQSQRGPVDTTGALLLIVGVAALQFMVDHGNQEDWFTSPLINGLACVALLALVLFGVWERYERYPIIDFSLFRYRSFTIALIGGGISYGAFFASMVLHPLWMQTTLGYSATQAGLAVSGYGVAAMVTALVYGAFIQRIPFHASALFGLAMFIFGAVLQTQLTQESPFSQHFWARVPQGFGIAIFQMCMTSLSLSEVPVNQYPAATGLQTFARVLTGSMATALSVWLWNDRTQVHHYLLAEGVTPLSTSSIQMPLDLAHITSLEQLNNLANRQASSLAFTDVCWLTIVIFLLLMLLMLMAPRKHSQTGAPASAH